MVSNFDCTIDLTYDETKGLYELFYTTYNGNPNTTRYIIFPVSRRHNGRMDKVSYDIYGSNKYVSGLCLINNFIDPFAVSDGDLLIYLPENEMENLKNVSTSVLNPNFDNISAVKNDLINMLKQQRLDGNRKKFLDNATTPLPPTVLLSDAPQIVVENNAILIAPTLFNNPNTVDNTLNVNTNTNPNNVVQRVLVKKYNLKAN